MATNNQMQNQSVLANIDKLSVFIYICLVVFGWMSIYSASLPLEPSSIFDLNQIFGKQLLFIVLCIPVITVLLAVDAKIFEKYSFIFYVVGIILLMGLFVFGKTSKGQTNWYQFGGISMQPSEFAKIGTALLLSKYITDVQPTFKEIQEQIAALAIVFIPVFFILLQPDMGSAMIFFSLFITLNREEFPTWYLWAGAIVIIAFILALLAPLYILLPLVFVSFVLHYLKNKKITRNIFIYIALAILTATFIFSVEYVFENVLEPHQKDRVNVLLGENVDMRKEGYNLNQSMIAIGSGGWGGKGWLEGTQTKGGFVPEQHTDYIFTTVGEEFGFVGSVLVVFLFTGLFLRIVYLAEKQRSVFSRVYGYCVASILFMHFFLNITMLIGLFPTIGVPLPFFSYGGSSLIAFTILLFIFLKLDANKVNEW